MKKYSFDPFTPSLPEKNGIMLEIDEFKRAYQRCDEHINGMRFIEDVKGSPVEIHLYVNLRKAIQDVITALDDIETCRRHLYGED